MSLQKKACFENNGFGKYHSLQYFNILINFIFSKKRFLYLGDFVMGCFVGAVLIRLICRGSDIILLLLIVLFGGPLLSAIFLSHTCKLIMVFYVASHSITSLSKLRFSQNSLTLYLMVLISY